MDKQEYNLESIKDHILQILKDKSGTSTVNYVKDNLRDIENIAREDKKGGIVITKCIDDLKEATLIRLEGENVISLTERGDKAAQMGYIKYCIRQKHKDQLAGLKTWTDVISKIVTITIPLITCCDSIFKIELIPIEWKSFILGYAFSLAITLVVKAVKMKLCK